MNLFIISILFASAFAGGSSVFFLKRDNRAALKFILAFSGAYLFSITVLHLMPHVYNHSEQFIGLYVLGGFLFQLLMEQFSEGIEHGHVHKQEHGAAFPLGIMISLCLHAFLEGMPLSQVAYQKELIFGIALHHIPAAFALGSLLIQTRLSKSSIAIYLAIFATATPLGYMLSFGINSGSLGNLELHFDKIMAIVIGIFLHISTTILFESSSADHHVFNRQKLIAVLLGIGISLLNFVLFGTGHS
ncbi:Zinc transporter ZupT [bacterium A37T11]|nr:Zinc transporter ZupT [bacterium A37T11]